MCYHNINALDIVCYIECINNVMTLFILFLHLFRHEYFIIKTLVVIKKITHVIHTPKLPLGLQNNTKLIQYGIIPTGNTTYTYVGQGYIKHIIVSELLCNTAIRAAYDNVSLHPAIQNHGRLIFFISRRDL